jgi:CheY-like chemotaxis protein
MKLPPPSTEPPFSGKGILVVEDTGIVASEIMRLLRDLGCRVVGPVTTLKDALRSAHDEQIDGALLDVNLQGEEAFPAADTLLERHIPFLFLTGYSQRSLPAKYRQLPCLEKPFTRRSIHARSQWRAERGDAPGPAWSGSKVTAGGLMCTHSTQGEEAVGASDVSARSRGQAVTINVASPPPW